MQKSNQVHERRRQIAGTAAENFKKTLQATKAGIQVESPKRLIDYNSREAKRPLSAAIVAATERRLRDIDQSTLDFPTDSARKAGVAVARLFEIGDTSEMKGFGTGFLVAPNIIITNWHVFKSAKDAVGCAANFLHEKPAPNAVVEAGVSFRLRPERFFYSNEQLDFALVYVEEDPIEGQRKLASLGMIPLIASKGKVIKGSNLNIIQYPDGGPKKYTTEDNAIINIDDETGDIFYYTDTAVGASGSPGYNDFWEVASLHYTGVPEKNQEGQWLTKTGAVWDKNTMTDDDVNWIANAGKSISKIVEHLSLLTLTSENQKYINRVMEQTKDPLNNTATLAPEVNVAQRTWATSVVPGGITMNFYGNTSVTVNQVYEAIPLNKSEAALSNAPGAIAVEKKERFDENYDNRIGYLDDFLSGFIVPLPEVEKDKKRELYKKFEEDEAFVAKYIHYSLVTNKKRRMAMWTASNVNYNPKFRDARERKELGSGAWRLDPRIPAKYQIQASEFYDPATLIDKGAFGKAR